MQIQSSGTLATFPTSSCGYRCDWSRSLKDDGICPTERTWPERGSGYCIR